MVNRDEYLASVQMNRVMLTKSQQKLLKERSDWLLHFYLDDISNWPYWHIDTPDASPDTTPTSYSSSSSDEKDSLQAVTMYSRLQEKHEKKRTVSAPTTIDVGRQVKPRSRSQTKSISVTFSSSLPVKQRSISVPASIVATETFRKVSRPPTLSRSSTLSRPTAISRPLIVSQISQPVSEKPPPISRTIYSFSAPITKQSSSPITAEVNLPSVTTTRRIRTKSHGSALVFLRCRTLNERCDHVPKSTAIFSTDKFSCLQKEILQRSQSLPTIPTTKSTLETYLRKFRERRLSYPFAYRVIKTERKRSTSLSTYFPERKRNLGLRRRCDSLPSSLQTLQNPLDITHPQAPQVLERQTTETDIRDTVKETSPQSSISTSPPPTPYGSSIEGYFPESSTDSDSFI